MGVERCRCHRLAAVAEKSRIGLPLTDSSAGIDVENLDLVALRTNREDGRVLVHAQRLQVVLCRLDRLDAPVHTNVPKLDFSVTAT